MCLLWCSLLDGNCTIFAKRSRTWNLECIVHWAGVRLAAHKVASIYETGLVEKLGQSQGLSEAAFGAWRKHVSIT